MNSKDERIKELEKENARLRRELARLGALDESNNFHAHNALIKEAMEKRKPTDEGYVRITRELIEAGATGPAGFKRKQLAILGVKWPPRKGWKSKLIRGENYLTEDKAEEFLALSGERSK